MLTILKSSELQIIPFNINTVQTNQNEKEQHKKTDGQMLTNHFNDLHFSRQPQVVDERLNVAFHLNAVILHHCIVHTVHCYIPKMKPDFS